jgi:uncharacterized membrane protein required for colicin V production
MAITDIVTLLLSIYLVIRGSLRGFLNSFLIPLCLIAGTFLSVFYYQATENLLQSLIIALVGPIILSFLLDALIKKWVEATNRNVVKPDLISRLGGALLTLAWGWLFIIFTLILIEVLPPWGTTMAFVHNDVKRSYSYTLAQPVEQMLFGASSLNTPNATDTAASQEDAKTLAQDPRFQKILQDPDIQKDIEARDLGKLIGNPKMVDLVQEIMKDPVTMKKVMALYKAQPATPEANPPTNK